MLRVRRNGHPTRRGMMPPQMQCRVLRGNATPGTARLQFREGARNRNHGALTGQRF
jgi:hypothetical protein